MIVAQYWAECRLQHKLDRKQITVKRFGWSDRDQQDAQANADRRAREALDRLVSGEKLRRVELKRAYNGADGVPIREEILERIGDAVITRNAYGARCLNTPNVFFADIDLDGQHGFRFTLNVIVVFIVTTLVAFVVGWLPNSPIVIVMAFGLSILLGGFLAGLIFQLLMWWRGGAENVAMERIRDFCQNHTDWSMRMYRTPAGLRAMATHALFDPNEEIVAECFEALRTDRIYVAMCKKQRCFRARISPKPWRIGISTPLRGRVWPVPLDKVPARIAWVKEYDDASMGYAACTFIETIGTGRIHPSVRGVQELHDLQCHVNENWPIG